MTGLKDEDVQQQCIDLGCVAFLRKPVPESVLMKAIAKDVAGVSVRGGADALLEIRAKLTETKRILESQRV